MKKVISLLIATVVLLSVVPGTFAAEMTTESSVTPTFGVYNTKYPGKKLEGGEYLVYKTSSSTGVPSLSVNFPNEIKGTNASANYPSAKWYKIDFDMNMKVEHKFSFLFRYSFTQNSAYIPNYYDPEKGILTKTSNVPVKAGEKLHLSFLFDLQDNVRYFFINNQLVTFQKMTTAGIGNLMYINMSSAPTTATLESGEELPIFSITNASARLYDMGTTIEDLGLYNWMYSETQTEEGYSYDVVASWEGYAAFMDTSTIANKMGAYVAGYDTDGKLVDISPFLTMNGTTQKLTMTSDTKINEFRIFVWGGTSADNIFGKLVPVLPSMNAMKVQTLKPATAGFVDQAN